jgi:hypothetical protein
VNTGSMSTGVSRAWCASVLNISIAYSRELVSPEAHARKQHMARAVVRSVHE